MFKLLTVFKNLKYVRFLLKKAMLGCILFLTSVNLHAKLDLEALMFF
jgi:hypothetical protein